MGAKMKDPEPLSEELIKALRGHGRRRSVRRFAATAFLIAGFVVPWALGFNRTDSIICLVGAVVLWGVGETELRLKAMQVRLAKMDDKLDHLCGNEPEGNLLLELSDW